MSTEMTATIECPFCHERASYVMEGIYVSGTCECGADFHGTFNDDNNTLKSRWSPGRESPTYTREAIA